MAGNFDWNKYPAAQSGSSGFDWDKYPSEGARNEKSEEKSRKFEAALEGFGEGATLGYLNNIQAAAEKPITAVLNAVTGNDVEADDYVTARDKYNRRQDELRDENPKSFAAGEVAGTVASSIPVARAAQGATALARAGQAARAGATYGALQNTSETEGEFGNLNARERIANAVVGAATGAGSSLGADAVAKGVQKGTQAVSNARNRVGNYLKKGAEDLAENSTGATRTQADKFRKGSGRYLLDNELVQFGDDVEKVAERANASISKSEQAIDSSLKALDEQGVKVSQDKIVSNIQEKINELAKDSSQADVVKKLNSIVDDIINTGESNISSSSAEQAKRGFNKMAKNWQDPEKGQAGKIAYRAYRDAVEETATEANPAIAKTFKEAKENFGRLAPIADAAEKRVGQLKQSPLGGLLDTTAVVGGAMGADDPVSGGALGLGAALLRRKVSPRIASSLAVTMNSVSKKLLQNPEIARVAQVNPDAFRATVFSILEDLGERPSSFARPRAADNGNFDPSMLPSPDNPNPSELPSPQNDKGPQRWIRVGAEKLNQAGISQDQIEALRKTKAGQNLLIDASDASPGSTRMKSILQKIRTASSNGGE